MSVSCAIPCDRASEWILSSTSQHIPASMSYMRNFSLALFFLFCCSVLGRLFGLFVDVGGSQTKAQMLVEWVEPVQLSAALSSNKNIRLNFAITPSTLSAIVCVCLCFIWLLCFSFHPFTPSVFVSDSLPMEDFHLSLRFFFVCRLFFLFFFSRSLPSVAQLFGRLCDCG